MGFNRGYVSYVNGARRNREAHLNGVQICYVTSLAIYRSHLGLCFSLLLKRTETEWRLRFRTQASSGWCLVLFKGDIHVPSRAKDNLISCIVRWIRPMKQSASCHMSFEWAQCARNKSHCRIDGRSTIITWRQISSSTPYYRATNHHHPRRRMSFGLWLWLAEDRTRIPEQTRRF